MMKKGRDAHNSTASSRPRRVPPPPPEPRPKMLSIVLTMLPKLSGEGSRLLTTISNCKHFLVLSSPKAPAGKITEFEIAGKDLGQRGLRGFVRRASKIGRPLGNGEEEIGSIIFDRRVGDNRETLGKTIKDFRRRCWWWGDAANLVREIAPSKNDEQMQTYPSSALTWCG